MPWRRLLLAAAILTTAASATAKAGDLSVTPVRLVFTAQRAIATMVVRNVGEQPSSLQMRVFAWSQRDGEDTLEPTRDVLANPGGFELAPGASQLARFGLRVPSGPAEKSYRVLVQETPRADLASTGEITTLLRISVPIFVEAPAAKPALAWSLHRTPEGELAVDAANTGSAHVQITRLTLTAPAGGPLYDQAVSVYVLAGSHRRITAHPSRAVTDGERLQLTAVTDGPPITAMLPVEGPTVAPPR